MTAAGTHARTGRRRFVSPLPGCPARSGTRSSISLAHESGRTAHVTHEPSRVSRLHLDTLRRDITPSGGTQRPMHARPDAHIIRRNIAMHALAEFVRIAGPTAGTPRAVASIAPARCDAPVAPHARPPGTPRFPASPI